MHCEEVRSLLDTFLDEELSQEDAREIAHHVLHCDACRAIFAQWERKAQQIQQSKQEKASEN